MIKSWFFGTWLVLAAFLLPTNLSAQEIMEPVDSVWADTVAVADNDVDEVIEVVDSIYIDEDDLIVDSVLTDTGELVADTFKLSDLEKWKRSIPQYDLKEYEWVDICYNPKYAIVSKDGKKGIYDLMLHKNVTEIEYRYLGFSKQTLAEDSAYISLFYATKGIKRGIISLYEPTNDVVSMWMDDPDEVYSLDDCTTIDKFMTRAVKTLSEKSIKKQQLDKIQVVVLDAKTGHLNSWVALEADMEKEDAGKLLVHSCAASLTKPFHTVMALENDNIPLDSICNGMSYRQVIKMCNNQVMQQAITNGYRRSVADRKWRELTDTGNPATSPFIMAVGYNSLAHNGTMIIPTMNADSVNVQKDVFTSTNVANLRDVLRVDRTESPQLAWLYDEMEWTGYATSEYIYDEADKEKETPVGKQVQFAGTFPAENPRYTICVVADKYSLDVEPSILQDVVNPLVRFLNVNKP
ncbi:MAG: hypothetical protein J5965_27015 [Aeriscardovia sp.]|nr:hypothetical protein [Aeriscardovia sp.]